MQLHVRILGMATLNGFSLQTQFPYFICMYIGRVQAGTFDKNTVVEEANRNAWHEGRIATTKHFKMKEGQLFFLLLKEEVQLLLKWKKVSYFSCY